MKKKATGIWAVVGGLAVLGTAAAVFVLRKLGKSAVNDNYAEMAEDTVWDADCAFDTTEDTNIPSPAEPCTEQSADAVAETADAAAEATNAAAEAADAAAEAADAAAETTNAVCEVPVDLPQSSVEPRTAKLHKNRNHN